MVIQLKSMKYRYKPCIPSETSTSIWVGQAHFGYDFAHLLFHSACHAPLWNRQPMQNCTGVTNAHLMISSRGKPSIWIIRKDCMMGIMGKTMPSRNTGSVRQALA